MSKLILSKNQTSFFPTLQKKLSCEIMEGMKDELKTLADKAKALAIVLDNIPLHIVITDPDGKVITANKAVETITGFKKEEIIGKTPRLWGQQMDKSFYEEFWKVIKDNKKIYAGIITNKKKSGAKYHAAVKVSPILDKNNELIGFCGIEQDITDIQKLSDEHDLSARRKDILKRSMSFS
ncbi:MAG: PAS domain-containing protein [Patescibacteria group bacterium]